MMANASGCSPHAAELQQDHFPWPLLSNRRASDLYVGSRTRDGRLHCTGRNLRGLSRLWIEPTPQQVHRIAAAQRSLLPHHLEQKYRVFATVAALNYLS